jgi:Tol biopolymer transport system component
VGFALLLTTLPKPRVGCSIQPGGTLRRQCGRVVRVGSIAVALTALLTALGGAAPAAPGVSEPPLAAIVAVGATATAAVLPDGRWLVELPALYPGDTDPAVSPDGHRVAFVSTRDGNQEVYVADARTGQTLRVTRNLRAADRRPAWSPDGRRVAWQSGPPGAADLFVMRANGAGKRLLVGGAGDDADPAWSPDGTQIAFSSNRSGRRQLWVVAAAGGEPQPLARTSGRARAPAWAPGGERLAFARESGGDSDLWLLDLSDGSTSKLTRGTGWDARPDWAPSGERIAFERVTAGRRGIWILGHGGAPATPVDDTRGLADPDWARTDRSLVPRPDERLPDLDQRAPAGLVILQVGRRFHLGFASSTENRGRGPLVIRGVRLATQPMRADQIVELHDGATRVTHDVGRLHYEVHPPHRHWHLESFVRYELRRARDDAVTVRDRKSGFCLIDRWGTVSPRIPGSGPPRFVGDCEAGRPDARRVMQGTSVGYVDRYPAFFHGQALDVTRLPAGRYVLVHRANPDRAMRELRYSDDAASVLLELTWPDGSSSAPRVSVLRRCGTGERCPPRASDD